MTAMASEPEGHIFSGRSDFLSFCKRPRSGQFVNVPKPRLLTIAQLAKVGFIVKLGSALKDIDGSRMPAEEQG